MSEEIVNPSVEANQESQPLHQFLAWRLGAHLESFAKQLGKVSRGKYGKKTVHKLRVSCRKLRTTLKNFKGLLPPDSYTVLEHDLKVLANRSGVVRELDVLLKELEKANQINYTEKAMAGFEVLYSVVRKLTNEKRQSLQAVVESFAASSSYPLLADYVDQYHNLDHLAEACQTPVLRKKANKLLMTQLRKISNQAVVLAYDEPSDEFHQLRIRLKSLRYTMTDFSSLHSNGFEQQLDKMTLIQNLMGDIHDRQVWLAQLHEVFAVIAEQKGEDSKKYRTALFAGNILHRKWQDEINSAYTDFKHLWQVLAREKFWSSFLVELAESGSEERSNPVASERENEHLEDFSESTPE